MKTILVAGSARGLSGSMRQASKAIGTGLAENDFRLVTGSWPGVDHDVASAFLAALDRLGVDAGPRYLQVHYKRWKPFSAVLVKNQALHVQVSDGRAAHQEAVKQCDAGILIGGKDGAKRVALELIASGRPVLPLPLTGGGALDAYAEILERWSDHPVPGMTRSQFMSLSLPIHGRAEAIVRLLRAALHDKVDVFVSYRRSDAAGVAGRIADRIVEHLGPKRVFLDTQSIAPGAPFPARITQALRECRVVICVIGPHWDLIRLADGADYVRRELTAALEAGARVIPILAFGGALPTRTELPTELHGLLDHQAVLIDGNPAWERGMVDVLAEIDRVVSWPSARPSSFSR